MTEAVAEVRGHPALFTPKVPMAFPELHVADLYARAAGKSGNVLVFTSKADTVFRPLWETDQ